MKKIFTSIAVVAVVAFATIGATQAYFSDTETSTGNTFTAGSLDLKVDGEDFVVSITVEDIKPGDIKFRNWTLKNTGSVAGQPSIEFGSIVNFDNGCTDPEGDVDTTCGEPGEGEGELGARSYVMMRWRQGSDPWNTVNLYDGCGNTSLNGVGGSVVGLGQFTGCYDNYGFGNDTALPVLNQNEEVEVEFRLWIMNAIGNDIQTDSSVFDIVFHLDQV